MDFSDKLPFSICEFSPDGLLLATVHETKLVVRDVESLDVINVFKNEGTTSKLEWSADCKFILCAQYKLGIVQVSWSYVYFVYFMQAYDIPLLKVHCIDDSKWRCRITEGVAGISGAYWAPTCRHVLTVQEFQLKLSVWSLCEEKRWIIESPKYSDRGLIFSNDGKFFAALERRKTKDYIALYYTQTWELVNRFQVDSVDLENISWSPDDSAIAAWDTNLEYNILVYSPDGRLLVKYQAYEGYLGIKSVAWSNTGHFLAIGSFDQKLRIINNLTWSKISEHSHDAHMTFPHVVVYDEKEEDFDENKHSILSTTSEMKKHKRRPNEHPPELKGPTKYVIAKPPTEIVEMKPDPTSANLPKEGIGMVDWSCNDKYIITRNDNMPHTLWVWNTKLLSLCSVIKHDSPIRNAKWDPARQRLMLCTGKDKLYMWSQEGCSIVNIPLDHFKVRSFRWNPSGNSLLLMDKKYFCCCYINDPDLEGGFNGSAGASAINQPYNRDSRDFGELRGSIDFSSIADRKHGSTSDLE